MSLLRPLAWVSQACAAVVVLSAAAGGNTLYVNQNAEPGDGSGFDQPHYTCLQDALQHARDANRDGNPETDIAQILVAEGVYTPDQGTGDRTASFRLVDGVDVFGGYAFGGDRDWQLYPTVLSGDLNGDDGPDFINRDDNSYRVVQVADGAFQAPDGTFEWPFLNETVMDGFHIVGGFANGEGGHMRGGGIYSRGFNGFPATVTLRNLLIEGNIASERGGGFYGEHASPIFENVTFRGNTAAGGGGIGVRLGGEVTLTECTFEDNAATFGGGMYLHSNGTIAYITDSTFENNTTSVTGGAIAVETGARFEIDGSTFYANSAAGAGGAIDTWNILSSSIKNSSFGYNAASRGGAIWTSVFSAPAQDVLTIENSIFKGNAASESGGAIYSRNKRDILINTQIAGNEAPEGSAIYIWRNAGTGGLANAPVILSSTIADNTGSAAIRAVDHPFTMFNTIVYGNTSGFSISSGWPQPVVQYSTLQDGFSSHQGNISTAPLFVGPDDYRLYIDCASVDSGNNAHADGIEFDLLGDPRIQAHHGNPVPTINRGAYETAIVPSPACPADLNGDGVVNVSDLLLLLSAWGPNVGHAADLTGDGVVNVSDLLLLLGAWGACR